MTTKEIFVKEVNQLWDTLRKRDDTIFENIEISIDFENKFDELKENNNELYMQIISENSLYEKKKMIRSYFWENIVGDLYEHTLNIMKQANLLEEALESFEKSYKIETTARLILENGIFANIPNNKKKELTENTIDMCFYPHSFYERNKSIPEERDILEEAWVKPALQWTGDRVRDVARLTKNIYLALMFLLVSPATFTVGNLSSRIGDKINTDLLDKPATGMDPSLRKFYDFIESFWPANFIFKFLNKDLYDIASLLKKTNNLDDEYIQDLMKEIGADPHKLINKCWEKNIHQLSTSNPDNKNFMDYIRHIISGKGLANLLRDPKYNNETQIALLLRSDAAKPEYQKRFYDFRVCVYEKLFEMILGFAKTIYSMNDASYEIIKIANDAHRQKNFKAFFDLRPKQENEEAMFKIMKVLVSIDAIANQLEKRKGELVADKYIDRFVEFLRGNIKQVYTELNEMANQRKYNEDRYADDQPTDEEKAEAIAKERFDAKKSIFAD